MNGALTLKNNIDGSTVLFPHTSLPEQTLKRILTLFRPLRVFTPWYLEEPAFMKPYLDAEAVRNVYPPEEAKPQGDFFKILNAYKVWSLEHHDRGYAAFLKAQLAMDHSESRSWGIRDELRRFGQEAPPSEAPLSLKWHLILHLAREMEAQQQEADSLLRNLKDKKSPLQGALEKDDVESVFADLPHFQADPMLGESHWAQIVDAWVGLFGGDLAENEVLVTFDRRVFEYVLERIDPSSFAGMGHPDPPLIFEMPDFSAHTLEELNGIAVDGMGPGTQEAIAKLFGGMGEMREEAVSERETLVREIQSSFSRNSSQKAVRITATPISPPVEGTSDQAYGVFLRLVGKSIVLFEAMS